TTLNRCTARMYGTTHALASSRHVRLGVRQETPVMECLLRTSTNLTTMPRAQTSDARTAGSRVPLTAGTQGLHARGTPKEQLVYHDTRARRASNLGLRKHPR